MSRIGKMPIPLPKSVTVTVGESVTVKGPKGQLEIPLVDGITVRQDGDELLVERTSDVQQHRANHGLVRSLLFNMVTGVTAGFEKKLEIQGVGYRAEVKGRSVVFHLGYSHPIEYNPPKGVEIKVEKNIISVLGFDKQSVGHESAVIRGFRPPDAYKGKGIRYAGEHIKLKPGKSAKS